MTRTNGDDSNFPEPVSANESAKRKRFLIILGISLLSVVAVALIAVKVVNSQYFAPRSIAEEYWQALQEGKASVAQKLEVNPEKSPLLSNTGYGTAADRPTSVAFGEGTESSTEDGQPAFTYAVSYDLGGTNHSTQTKVIRTGKRYLFFDDWKIANPHYGELEIVSPVGIQINDEVQVKPGKLSVYPGTYTLNDLNESGYVEVITDPITLAVGETRVLELQFGLTEEGKQLAINALQERLRECNEVVSNEPNPCELRIFASPEEKFDFEWSVSTEPGEVTFTNDENDISLWHFEMVNSVEAHGLATPKPGTTELGDPRKGTQTLRFGGTISLVQPQKPEVQIERILW